ncbi:hypothetical protein Tco_0522010 [Tanacetum coccineum]
MLVVRGIANLNVNPNGNGNFIAARAEGNGNGNNGIANTNVNPNGNGNFVATRAEGNGNGNNGIYLQAEELDLMADAGDIDEIEEVNANCILMANLQQASTSGTQTDKALVYDSNGTTDVHHYENCYNNDIFIIFTQEEHYTKLLDPITEPHTVLYNNSNVISVGSSVEHSGGTMEQHPAVEETHAYYKSLYNNLAIEVEKVNTVNRKINKTNADLTTELARYRSQEKVLKTIRQNLMNLKLLSKEKSIVSLLQEEKKRLKSDFKTREDELLDKKIQYEKRIKELDNILVKIEKHDPPVVYDSKETLQLTQEGRSKMKQLNKEIKVANYAKINKLSKVFVSQKAKLREEVYFSNTSKMDSVSNTVSKLILIPDDEFSDDTPSVAWKFLNKGKSMDTQCESDSLDPLSLKLEDENVELEFQVLNYAKENTHLKTTYKNLFNSINVTRAETKIITDSLQDKLNDTIYENAKLRAQLFDKISEQKDTTKGTSANIKEDKFVRINKVRASIMINPITVSQPHLINQKDVNSDSNGLSSIGINNTAKTTRPQPRRNTKNDRVLSASKSSCIKNKENDKSKIVYAMCKQCLITSNHDVCVLNYVNDMNSCADNQNVNVSNAVNQKKHKPKVKKTKKVGSKERLASPKFSKPRTCLRWSPTGRIFCLKGKLIVSNDSECQYDNSKGDNACTSNPRDLQANGFQILLFPWKAFLGTVRFGNDHIAVILGYEDLQWGNILIIKVYFFEGLGHNLFSVGQFCDSDLEVALRRNTCFVRNLEGVDLLKENHTTNLYTINLHEMAFASSICLMARATSTKY